MIKILKFSVVSIALFLLKELQGTVAQFWSTNLPTFPISYVPFLTLQDCFHQEFYKAHVTPFSFTGQFINVVAAVMPLSNTPRT